MKIRFATLSNGKAISSYSLNPPFGLGDISSWGTPRYHIRIPGVVIYKQEVRHLELFSVNKKFIP